MAPLADAPARLWVDRSGRTVAYALLGVALAAWLTMLTFPGVRMPGMSGAMSERAPTVMAAASHRMVMGATAVEGWSWTDLIAFTGSWALMMAAMMLPSATPMIALYSTVARRRGARAVAVWTAMFVAPYVALWALSGVPVYGATLWINTLTGSHRWAHQAAPYAVAATLLTAGAYQFSPLKRRCLANCRNPLSFLAAHWRSGAAGAARIGLLHALDCVGCCALLMVVLVAAGAMGLAWVLLIAGAVTLEKLASRWRASPAFVGLALVLLGTVIALHPSLAGHLRS